MIPDFLALPKGAKIGASSSGSDERQFLDFFSGAIGVAQSKDFVGPYRLFHLIRAGATFEIWAVRPTSEDKVFAMKWLPKGRKYNSTSVAELKHEYTVGKLLDHESCIQTYEYGTSKNGAYLVMELFKQFNIKQHIIQSVESVKQGGPNLILHRAKEVLTSAAAAISHMHSKGWVHRDIKPDNFLLSPENVVKLIDFTIAAKTTSGLGKLLGAKSKVQGTYSYMAPEQISGKGVDPRDDVYSLGCMAHELLTGKVPFTANSPNELLQSHLTRKPPLVTVANKNVRPEFAAYVQRMLAKERKDRPDTIKEVMLKLKTEPIFYSPPPPPEEAPQAAEDQE